MPAKTVYQIEYKDHVVRMNAKGFGPEFASSYLEDMKAALSPKGTANDHRNELKDMNNDGTWTVRAKKPA